MNWKINKSCFKFKELLKIKKSKSIKIVINVKHYNIINIFKIQKGEILIKVFLKMKELKNQKKVFLKIKELKINKSF